MKILADKRIKQFFVRAGLLTLVFTLLSAVFAGLECREPKRRQAREKEQRCGPEPAVLAWGFCF